MKYYVLFYSVVDDFVARSAAYRDDHLRLAQEAHRRGELLLAGALTDPADRALLVFRSRNRNVPCTYTLVSQIDTRRTHSYPSTRRNWQRVLEIPTRWQGADIILAGPLDTDSSPAWP
jgi:hypothetical protein